MQTLRRPSLPLLVLVAVVALVVGSLGTAVAGPALTKGKVKKIATKVVNKLAKDLTVASAATAGNAGNASNLGGQPPAAYLNNTHRFRVPTAAPSPVKTFVFDGLAAGSYVVSYQILLSTAQTASCSVLPGGGATVYEALGYSTTVANTSLVTGSGVVALDGVAKPKLICEARLPSTDIEIQAGADYPSTVVFTKVGPLTTGTATPTLSSRPARTLP